MPSHVTHCTMLDSEDMQGNLCGMRCKRMYAGRGVRQSTSEEMHGVATVSRIDTNTGPFCKRDL